MKLREDSIVMGERGDDFPEVAKLAKIALANQVTSCTSERQFSFLCRVRTYFMIKRIQTRLNRIALLHGQKVFVRSVYLKEMAGDFIQLSTVRGSTLLIVG